MNHPARQFWFGKYWWLTPLASVCLIAIIHSVAKEDNQLNLMASVIGGAFGVVFFVQKQKLEETTLFVQLFTQFNERYAKLNDKLQDIRTGRMADWNEACKTLNDYFNLCAEEYLFYSEGRIHSSAWRSWCKGMKYYIDHEKIKGYWEQEIALGSYYGLTLKAIEWGAI